MTAKIRECKCNGHTWTGRTVASIIRRVFGEGSYFHEDHGLRGYGQIVSPNGSTDTGRVSVTGKMGRFRRYERDEITGCRVAVWDEQPEYAI